MTAERGTLTKPHRIASADGTLEAGRLVLRAGRAGSFCIRRAEADLRALPSADRRMLERALDALTGDPARPACALLEWAGWLEARSRLADAGDVLDLAMERRPTDAEVILHMARVARKSGDLDRARELYDRVRTVDEDSSRLSRMADVGHALLARNTEAALSRALRAALRAGDREAAAVAQEERARARRSGGDVEGALRDYAAAAVRFADPMDRGRILHEAADLLVAAGDPLAARRVLLECERSAHPRQAEAAGPRLRALSRVVGDELGVRRWSRTGPAAFVWMGPRHAPDLTGSRAQRLDRWMGRLSNLA